MIAITHTVLPDLQPCHSSTDLFDAYTCVQRRTAALRALETLAGLAADPSAAAAARPRNGPFTEKVKVVMFFKGPSPWHEDIGLEIFFLCSVWGENRGRVRSWAGFDRGWGSLGLELDFIDMKSIFMRGTSLISRSSHRVKIEGVCTCLHGKSPPSGPTCEHACPLHCIKSQFLIQSLSFHIDAHSISSGSLQAAHHVMLRKMEHSSWRSFVAGIHHCNAYNGCAHNFTRSVIMYASSQDVDDDAKWNFWVKNMYQSNTVVIKLVKIVQLLQLEQEDCLAWSVAWFRESQVMQPNRYECFAQPASHSTKDLNISVR